MVFVRKPHLQLLQGVFKVFRDINEFATGDLYEMHPTKAHTWHHAGRCDDGFKLSNGETVRPAPMEDIMSEHKKIQESMVVGRGRFQPAVLIELREIPESENEMQALRDDIWSTIEKVNAQVPAFSRLLKQFVMFSSPDKPFVRVGKGK